MILDHSVKVAATVVRNKALTSLMVVVYHISEFVGEVAILVVRYQHGLQQLKIKKMRQQANSQIDNLEKARKKNQATLK